MSTVGTVYVVHCVDTEGPLHESIEATFERLHDLFQLDLEPSAETLQRLQTGELDLGGLEPAVRRVVDPHLLAYNETWDDINRMLESCLSSDFRTQLLDSAGGGWIYNWFCVDHVDYSVNPRHRDLGYHKIFDRYRAVLGQTASAQDGLHFHYHPHNFRREAHHCATHWWASSNSLQEILCRRVIDRQWFPAANRPGFHVIRPDSHWFLEQFIPFDFSSQAVTSAPEDRAQADAQGGRFGDWRRAPANWQPYHPAHDDYQIAGTCRRWIFRCLNIGTRYRLLTEHEMHQGFREAMGGKPVVLAFTDHDFRDMRRDVDAVRGMLLRVSADYPEVPFRFSEAIDAAREALQLATEEPCDLDLSLRSAGDGSHVLEVVSTTPTFGPQPWLALKTTRGEYHYDNFDVQVPFHRWSYVFDSETYQIQALERIGVAANSPSGCTTVSLLDPATGQVLKKYWNTSKTRGSR